MKLTIALLALASAAQAATFAAPVPVRISLPGVRVPTVAITPKIGLPTPVVPVVVPTASLKPVVVPAGSLILPGAFNPNSPITFPEAGGDNTGKVGLKLAALFDGAEKKDVPAVPVDKAELPSDEQPVKPTTIRAERGNSHVTLPESDLIREIGL